MVVRGKRQYWFKVMWWLCLMLHFYRKSILWPFLHVWSSSVVRGKSIVHTFQRKLSGREFNVVAMNIFHVFNTNTKYRNWQNHAAISATDNTGANIQIAIHGSILFFRLPIIYYIRHWNCRILANLACVMTKMLHELPYLPNSSPKYLWMAFYCFLF